MEMERSGVECSGVEWSWGTDAHASIHRTYLMQCNAIQCMRSD